MRASTGLLAGTAAGAAGTTALNAVTYLDMVLRARPASSTPEDTVEALAAAFGLTISGKQDQRRNRVMGLGSITGLAAGVGVGAILGMARGLGLRPRPLLGGLLAAVGAMTASNGPMAALGVSDPQTWAATDWAADIVPHLAYGVVTAAVLQGLDND